MESWEQMDSKQVTNLLKGRSESRDKLRVAGDEQGRGGGVASGGNWEGGVGGGWARAGCLVGLGWPLWNSEQAHQLLGTETKMKSPALPGPSLVTLGRRCHLC